MKNGVVCQGKKAQRYEGRSKSEACAGGKFILQFFLVPYAPYILSFY